MLVPLQKEPVIRGARGRVGGSEEAEKAEEEKRKRGEKRASSGREAGGEGEIFNDSRQCSQHVWEFRLNERLVNILLQGTHEHQS